MLALLLAACRSPTPSEPAQSGAAAPEPVATSPSPARSPTAASGHRVQALVITVLSTTKAPVGTGEWGFSALVEADGHRLLFDTGAKPDTVLHNAAVLGVDLATIPMVVLSHHHDDHVGGLMTLRTAVAERTPAALATAHVAAGMFTPRRRGTAPRELNTMIGVRPAFEASGGAFVVHDRPAEIAPGVWVTGPVPRVHPEHNWSGARMIEGPEGWVEDTLLEGQELVIDTDEGLVVLSGCGHAGVVNIVAHARSTIRSAPLRAAVGGFHLMDATPAQIEWTGEQLRAVGLQELYAAHCTGDAAIEHFGAQVVPAGGRAVELGVGGQLRLPAP